MNNLNWALIAVCGVGAAGAIATTGTIFNRGDFGAFRQTPAGKQVESGVAGVQSLLPTSEQLQRLLGLMGSNQGGQGELAEEGLEDETEHRETADAKLVKGCKGKAQESFLVSAEQLKLLEVRLSSKAIAPVSPKELVEMLGPAICSNSKGGLAYQTNDSNGESIMWVYFDENKALKNYEWQH